MAHFIEIPVVDSKGDNEGVYYFNTTHIVWIAPRYDKNDRTTRRVIGSTILMHEGANDPWTAQTLMLPKDVFFLCQ